MSTNRPNYFYYQTVKNIISAFGILFRDVKYEDDYGKLITVPIHYAPKEKFVEMITVTPDFDDGYATSVVLPRFGFELTDIVFDSSRMTNRLNKLEKKNEVGNVFMFNRIPYNFSFTLYLATRKMEDSLKIFEQIVPFFAPEMNISIKDKSDFGLVTDIPVILTNSSFSIDYLGSFDNPRVITWQFGFLLKAWLYSNVREQERIKETILKMEDKDFNYVFDTLTSNVKPRSVEKSEDHDIIDKLYKGPDPVKLLVDCVACENAIVDLVSDTPYTVLEFENVYNGSHALIIWDID